MHSIIQKLSLTALIPLLLVVLAPVLAVSTASAAAAGSCRLLTNQGVASTKVALCKTFMPNGKDANGTAWLKTKCYGLDERNASITISQTLACSDPLMSGAKVVLCKDGITQAPNNDASKCTTAQNATSCVIGNEPICPVNQESCSTPGDTVAKCTDPAADGAGGCNSEKSCNLITQYIDPLIAFLSAAVGVAVVISIVIGGIQYGSSAGDSQKVNAAKNRIRNSIIALIAFIFLYALLNFLIPGGLV